ncbi:uncharacterized protein LOC122374691 [Amphibalanus amphitrite]|uniref:uncharacterized protein LOC122374691 n=1 Tax=Amphibalanus amphitrite TaxID=1232801 RepID=UPI001C910062|nr:uncharacterized protein LOC122374691 [Amphibalanus amphitrite]
MLLQHIQQGAAAGARPVDGSGALAAAGGGSAPTASGGGGAPAATGGGSAPAAAAVTESVAAAAAVPPTVGSRQRICLPATGTPVPRLHSSASLIEFDTWRRKFDGYCLLTRVRELTTAEQKAALIAVLDDDWTRIVDFGLQLPADADLDSVLEAMQKYLRRQRNVIVDRMDFTARLQQPGESIDEYVCALREIAACCDFCQHCADDRFRDHIVVGTIDSDARRRMLETADLTFEKALDICRACECATNNNQEITQSGTVGRISRYRQEKNRRRFASEDSIQLSRCRRCGAAEHSDDRRCPALGRACNSCGERDHFAVTCRGRASGRRTTESSLPRIRHDHERPRSDELTPPRAERGRSRGPGTRRADSATYGNQARRTSATSRRRQQFWSSGGNRVAGISGDGDLVSGSEEDEEADSTAASLLNVYVSDVRLKNSSVKRSPRIELETMYRGRRPIPTTWTPDTGAEVSVISRDQARLLGVELDDLRPSKTTLWTADGRKMHCMGTCNLTLLLGDVSHSAEISVMESLHTPLLSWHDCVKLGILPPGFPRQIRRLESHHSSGGPDSEPAGARSRSSPAAAPPTRAARPRSASPATTRQPPAWISKMKRCHTGIPPDEHRQQHFAALKAEFPKVFDIESGLREMVGEPMSIELTDDATPYAQTSARNIPFNWRDDVRRQLDELLQHDVIEAVEHPTEWCHPLCPVAKTDPDGKSVGCRITVDFTKLNRFVKRPVHPGRTPQDAVSSIATGASFFTKLDCKAGYHQMALREQDRDLTCFITPWGRYRYKRMPMGITHSGDVYNRRGDQALGDIPNTVKVVDDMLAWDDDYSTHLLHVWKLLKRCDEYNITLNPAKCQFAMKTVDFCGYRVSSDGYTVDEKKVQAVKHFPQPNNITDLRAFLGLVNQLGAFSDEIASAAEPLRQLLKPRNAWLWTPAHTAAFEKVKTALVSPPILDFYNPTRRTVLETDASRLGGLGFCLRQQDENGNWRLIQCGSRFLTDVETRYAVIELELLALVWACYKADTYLRGMQTFEVVLDHRPLIPVLNKKTLAEIDNPRLRRLREKLIAYNFVTSWRQGKLHSIPDALSRAPVERPTAEDEAAEHDISVRVQSVVSSLTASDSETDPSPFKDAALEEVRAASTGDPELLALKHTIMHGFPDHRKELEPILQPYWGCRERLTVDNGLILCGQRLVIPQQLRRVTLERLHSSHQGIERTKRRARQVVYWPQIDKHISDLVGACSRCQRHLPSLQKEPLMLEPLPTRVFQAVSADYFSWAGRTYLVYADRLSGWPSVYHVRGEASARALTRCLRKMFAATGVPQTLRTDGGGQFTARHTREFLKKWGVIHQISTPHFPQSNGHAEAAVKNVKRLIKKTTQHGDLDTDEFVHALLELRNTPRADGRSPAQVLFGHPLRSAVPAHHRAFAAQWQEAADTCDARTRQQRSQTEERYNMTARAHPALRVGQKVIVQDPITKVWNRTGTVTGVGSRRDFNIRLPSGRLMWRNRRYLRPQSVAASQSPPPQPQSPPPQQRRPDGEATAGSPRPAPPLPPVDGVGEPPAPLTDAPAAPADAPEPRRSNRQRQRTKHLSVSWGTKSYQTIP